MEKSKVRAMEKRCGRKIKVKTANGRNKRKEEMEGAMEAEKSTLLRLWRRRSVLICSEVVVQERIFHLKLFVSCQRFIQNALHLHLHLQAPTHATYEALRGFKAIKCLKTPSKDP